MPAMPFHLGINYWPRETAMDWWKRFDAEIVRRDFALIGTAGFESVRIFALWEDFQPESRRVSGSALGKLVEVADIASNQGLSLLVTLFTGHMSGANWIPDWALDRSEIPRERFPVISGGRVVRAGIRNWYADPKVREAQARLAREVASALADHPALGAWDLGNEPSNCVVPPTREAGIRWLKQMSCAIRTAGSRHPVTLGLHMEDLEEDRLLGPEEAGRVCDFLSMHGYPGYAPWARSPVDELLLPFLGIITRWLGEREVLFEEFGAPTRPPASREEEGRDPRSSVPLLDERAHARFIRRGTESLLGSGVLGAMIWCFGDYVPELWDRAPFKGAVHERSFGLWRADGTPKPAVAEIASLAAEDRPVERSDPDWIEVSKAEYRESPAESLARLYRKYRAWHLGKRAMRGA